MIHFRIFFQKSLHGGKPVRGDKGKMLMKKMGWQPGLGLGKYYQGEKEPLTLDIKTDKRGMKNIFQKLFLQNCNFIISVI